MSAVIALSNDNIRQIAPAVFAPNPSPSVGPHYAFASTSVLLDALRQQGFVPVRAQQQATRTKSPTYARHIVHLRHQDDLGRLFQLGELIPEIAISNSHDTSSALPITAWLFRVWCANQATAPYASLDQVKFRHTRITTDDVIEGAFKVIGISRSSAQRVQEWKSIQLAPDQVEEFANRALALRWPNDPPISVERALTVRRPEDIGDNLLNVWQRLQETLTKGIAPDFRKRQARAISTLASVSLNQKLSSLAEEFAR